MTTGNPSTFDRLNNWLSTSLMVKILTIGFLILVLIIPLALIDNIVNERNGRKYEVAQTITNEWSGNQVINGPILTIPITHYEIKYDEEGNTEKILHESYYHFLPEHLEYSGDMEHQKLHRGIYEVAVYETDLASVGTFIKPQIEMRNLEAVSWDEAFLTIGITDMKGIKEDIVIKFGDQKLNIEPGSPIPMIIPAGFHSPISNLKDIQEGTTIDFEYSIQLKGSNDLQFTPLGKTTAIQLQSSWPDPSFTGN
ncbi:MAG: cell envelope integrity protein CreD, partial [Bacteroidia bacterium]|nr:cell envelope integrity protein CreD [Bacteroidia bacterium]